MESTLPSLLQTTDGLQRVAGLAAVLSPGSLLKTTRNLAALVLAPLNGYYAVLAQNIGEPSKYHLSHHKHAVVTARAHYLDRRQSTLPAILPADLVTQQPLDEWLANNDVSHASNRQKEAIRAYYNSAVQLIHQNELIRVELDVTALGIMHKKNKRILRSFLDQIARRALYDVPLPVHIQVIFKAYMHEYMDFNNLLITSHLDEQEDGHYAHCFEGTHYDCIRRKRHWFGGYQVHTAVRHSDRLHVTFLGL